MKEFFYAGGYGFYLWGAFGVTVVLMLGEVIVEGRLYRKMVARLKRMQRMKKA